MSGSKVISVLDTEVLAVKGGTTQLADAAAATGRTCAPSVWGDFFVTYTPPSPQACKLILSPYFNISCR
jgi:hypothetical protein